MANRGYGDPDGRGDGGDHDTSHMRTPTPGVVQSVAGPTSVGEQVRRGGWTRSDTPQPASMEPEDVPQLTAHRFQGGSAGEDGHDVAAYPGVPTPTPGTTY